MLNVAKISLAIVLSSLLVGCAPRSETKSLDEVLRIAQSRYEKVKSVGAASDVKALLDQADTKLQGLLRFNVSEVSSGSKEVADTLQSLVGKAGYTSRASLTELISQYRQFSQANVVQTQAPALKLLVSRTYSLMASELETTRFSIS